MSRKVIENRNYRTIATIPLGKGMATMLAADFIAELRRAKNLLQHLIRKDPDATLYVQGVKNAALEEVMDIEKRYKSFIAIDDLKSPSILAVVKDRQLKLDEPLVEDKVDLLKRDLIQGVEVGNRLAEQLASGSKTPEELWDGMKDTNKALVRNIIKNASRAKMRIDVEGRRLPLFVGGGLPVPAQIPFAEPVHYARCTILDFSKSSATAQILHADSVGVFEVKVTKDSREFKLLREAENLRCLVDCSLLEFEKVSDAIRSFGLVEITNQNELIDSVIERVQSLRGT